MAITRDRKNPQVVQAEAFQSFCIPFVQSMRRSENQDREEDIQIWYLYLFVCQN